MADIKFMNLSENGNPATTDSVLIGNSQDGLKRTTLGAISNMLTPKEALHFEEVKVSTSDAISQIPDDATTSYSAHLSITAPQVPGYTFVCWSNPAPHGFVTGTYITNPLKTSAQIWLTDVYKGNLSGNTATAIAMYVKNELA